MNVIQKVLRDAADFTRTEVASLAFQHENAMRSIGKHAGRWWPQLFTEELTVPAGKQMSVLSFMDIDTTVTVEGHLHLLKYVRIGDGDLVIGEEGSVIIGMG